MPQRLLTISAESDGSPYLQSSQNILLKFPKTSAHIISFLIPRNFNTLQEWVQNEESYLQSAKIQRQTVRLIACADQARVGM